jgi:signal transduction histidine kinase
MRSISARLSLWYAVAATATLASLFVVGYYMLHGYLIHGLDLLDQAEFEQIKSHLGPDYRSLSPAVIDERIRETTEYASVLFYIDIHGRESGTIFFSTNLKGRSIPDIKGKRHYDIDWDDVGRLRVGEFLLPPYDVILATPETHLDGVMEAYMGVCAALLALMLAISVAIGFGLSRLALRPVRLIRETASRIGSDNLSERIAVPEGNDEISELALLLNAMFDRLEASFKNVRRFAADASHELKTPLSLMRLHAEKLLSASSANHENEEALQTLLEEISTLNGIIDELLFLSRAEARSITLDLKPTAPGALLANFTVDAQVLADHHRVRFSCVHEGKGLALCEPRWVRRVLLNLFTNAVNASSPGMQIRLHSEIDSTLWRVAVEDEGSGVPPSEREHIFDRFVRLVLPGNPERQGSGLGLTICRGIIGLHGGRIFAESGSGGRGLRVVFEIPAIAAPPRSAEPMTSAQESSVLV